MDGCIARAYVATLVQLAWTIPQVAQLHEGEEFTKRRRGQAVMIVLRRVTYSHRQSCTGRRRDKVEKWEEEQVGGAGERGGRTSAVEESQHAMCTLISN